MLMLASYQMSKSQKVFLKKLALNCGLSFLSSLSLTYNHGCWVNCHEMSQHWIRHPCQQLLSMRSGYFSLWLNVMDFSQGGICTVSEDQMSQVCIFSELKGSWLFLSHWETDSPFSTLTGQTTPEWVTSVVLSHPAIRNRVLSLNLTLITASLWRVFLNQIEQSLCC